MELETFFTDQKWNIIKQLSEEKLSPLQIAERSNTSMANISQQLKLLEAVNLVKKEKVRNRDKGKPRTLFAMSHDYAYIISTMRGCAQKKLLILDKIQNTQLRILLLEEPTRYPVQKLFWMIEDSFNDISYFAVKGCVGRIQVLLASAKPECRKKLQQILAKSSIDITIVDENELKSMHNSRKHLFKEESNYFIIKDSLDLG